MPRATGKCNAVRDGEAFIGLICIKAGAVRFFHSALMNMPELFSRRFAYFLCSCCSHASRAIRRMPLTPLQSKGPLPNPPGVNTLNEHLSSYLTIRGARKRGDPRASRG